MKQISLAFAYALLAVCPSLNAQEWPELPERDAAVLIPAQAWPQKPGPRSVRVRIYYPHGSLSRVDAKTGVMLSLHNWGGEDCAGTANPRELANRLNVIGVCVNYLQSGRKASIEAPEPYDCGYLQALDALRALWFVCNALQQKGQPFDSHRLYSTGGSGGGNVTLMANKLAPRTFACIVDLCGMKKLSHDIAFHLPGGSGLNARWSPDPADRNYLSPDHQELRFVAHLDHLEQMRRLGNEAKIIVVHGVEDTTCPFADAEELVAHMRMTGLDVEPHFISADDLDGKVFTSAGHALGNRTEIVFRVAGQYLNVASPNLARRKGLSDFERREEIRYQTSRGQFVVSFAKGYPVGRFEASSSPPEYEEHQDLSYYINDEQQRVEVKSPEAWNNRRTHILEHMQRVMGPIPGPLSYPGLDIKVLEETARNGVRLRRIAFQSDPFDQVRAWVLLPPQITTEKRKLPAVLCLHQTTPTGKDEPAGLAGSPNMHYAMELAVRGYVTLAPDYPSFGEHAYDFAAHPEYASGTMKAIHDNRRAIDVLCSLPQVDPDRIGVIGHSLGGHNAMFTAALEPRLKVIVSSCGFTRFHKDDVPSWNGPRYMPRIASRFSNDADKLPFDFTEIVGAFAPRPFLAVAAVRDRDFDISGVRDILNSARKVYALFDSKDNLQAFYPDTPHDFPKEARRRAYEFLDEHLRAATP